MAENDLLNESIVEEVKKYEVLYNKAHPHYGKRSIAQQTWNKISNVVGVTVQECKSLWVALKRGYISEYEKLREKNNLEKYNSNWKYFEAMSFLSDHIDPDRNSMENLEHLPGRDAFCRACMANLNEAPDDPTSAPNYNIFSSNIQLDKKIMQCTNFECSPWDGYSHVVCHHCYVKILDFYDFQCVYRSSMEKFKVLLENELDFKDEDDEKISTISSVECDNNSFQINEENIYREDVHADNISGTAEDPLNSEDFANTQDVKNEKSSESPKQEFEIKEIGLKSREVRSTKLSPRRSGRKRKLHASKEEDNSTSDNEINSIEDLHHRSDDDDEQSISNFSSQSEDAEEEVTKKPILKCEICEKQFRFHHRLEAHRRKHEGLPGYPCTFENCQRAFNRLDHLRSHLNEHNGIPNVFQCNIDDCLMEYKCLSGLNKHKRSVHKCGKELKKYPCDICGKVLTNPRSLNGHKFIHVDKSEWPFVCDVKNCLRKFRLMSQLTIHKKRHAGIKNYICPYCGVRKTTCTELKIHINFHTFEQKYPCEYCSKVFKSVGVMRTHVHRVHEGKKPANYKMFSCDFCDGKFASLQTKKFHEMTHRGEKPFSCEECGKTFTYPSGLASHKNVHAKGENQYVCRICGRKFKWQSGLKTHLKLHTEAAKPYSCKECDKSFRWPGSYYKHKKVHMRQEEESVERENISPTNHNDDGPELGQENETQAPVESPKYEIIYATIDVDTNKMG
ncbi:zinc finger protein 729-like [Musca domestica]|uniref:Zinc finger protein 729-like n=1 Tax=Musca domestica TaxID=7370 RepID=A0ABM3VQV7_MUSDO|nr:zinc finger protein 729-like [Musca domestica]